MPSTPPPDSASPEEALAADGFEDAKRIIAAAIGTCLAEQIDPALVAAVLIGAGVNWYARHQGDNAVLDILQDTIRDIRSGRHRAGDNGVAGRHSFARH